MIFRRASALFAVVFAMAVVSITPALAADYPPGLQGTAVEVAGTKTGGVGSGSTGVAASGLPNTGFDGVLLWGALAILALGVALVVATRRRSHTN